MHEIITPKAATTYAKVVSLTSLQVYGVKFQALVFRIAAFSY